MRYQKARRLSATGVVTSAVWRALSADAAPKPAAKPAPKPAPSRRRSRPRSPPQAGPEARPQARAAKVTGKYAAYDKVVLKVGSKGAAVKVLQSALWVSPADGEFGPQTKAAVVAYQKAKQLTADGVVTSRGVASPQRRRRHARPQAGGLLHPDRQRLRPRGRHEPVRRLRPGAVRPHGEPDPADLLPGHHPHDDLGRGAAAGQPARPHLRGHPAGGRHRCGHGHGLRPGHAGPARP